MVSRGVALRSGFAGVSAVSWRRCGTGVARQEVIGMKTIQARALIDLMTNENNPKSPRSVSPR